MTSRTLRCAQAVGRSLSVAFCVWLATPCGAAAPNGREAAPDIALTLALAFGASARVMWVDATANLDRITTREGVRDIVARCKKAKFTTIVLDVKPVCGEVVYNSRIAGHLRQWRGKSYPDVDVLAWFVEDCRAAGLEIAASFNVFSEGHKYFRVGLGYAKPDWQSVTYVVERFLATGDGARLTIQAPSDAEEAQKPDAYTTGAIMDAPPAPGAQVAIEVAEDHRVAGVMDASLLGEEPLSAPDDGHLVVTSGRAVEWASQHARVGEPARFDAVGRLVPVTEAPAERVSVFVNPLHPDARKHEIDLLVEAAAGYDIDAIVMDRARFANVYNDFSNISRAAFERWMGRRLARWPDDVLRFDPEPGEPVRRGPYFRQWLEFRARVIRDFVREAADRVRAVRPSIQVAAYVGSWFTEYYGVGVNWGSEKYPVRTSWATPTYNEAGYAELLDWLVTGCYYPIATREDARAQNKDEGATVESAADLSVDAVASSLPVYAGLYALNYAGRPDAFLRAVQTASRRSLGVMIFDLSYIYDYNWWGTLEQAFAQPATPPHRIPGLTAELRTVFDAVRAPVAETPSRNHIPTVPYQPGGG